MPMQVARLAPDKSAPGSAVSWGRWFVGLVVVAALAWVVNHWAEVAEFEVLLRRAQPLWLIVAILLQAVTYICVAAGWALVLRRSGEHRPLGRLVPIALTKLFADQAMPTAGISGNIVLIDQLARLGVPRPIALAAIIVSMIGYYAAYAVFALVSLGLLWIHDRATPLLAGLVTVLLVVAMGLPAVAVWLHRRGAKEPPALVARIGPAKAFLDVMGQAPAELIADRALILSVGLCNGLVFLLDAATLLACLAAVGVAVAPSTALVALVFASIVATLGPIPMGLGSFEATCTAMLHLLGVTLGTAFAATMLLRFLTLWAPMAPGLVLLQAGGRRRSARGRQP